MVVDNAIEILGSDRLMFGSNFPIEKLWTSHAELIAAHRAAVAKHGAEGRSRHLLEHGRARLPACLNARRDDDCRIGDMAQDAAVA